MKKHFRRFRKDNKGVTLVLAIVAIAFVGVLASAILSAAATNYRLKIMDKYSKNTFYSADSITEEIHTGLGIMCYKALEEAYDYAASNLGKYSVTGGVVTVNRYNNEMVNKNMKEKYYNITGKKIFGKSSNTADKKSAIEYFNTLITKPEKAKVVGYSSVVADAASYTYTFKDVAIRYLEDKKEPYYSTIKIDIKITYPDIDIDFIADEKEWKAYFNYCLIADDKIEIGASPKSRGIVDVYGGMYSGGNVDVFSGSSLTLQDGLLLNNQLKVPTVLVSKGDINLPGGSSTSVLKVGNGSIWCNGITAGGDGGSGNVLYTSNQAKTYVADDLSLNGDNCNITIKGKYLGFGSNNALTSNPSGKASTSSAIIVNGRNCTLDMTDINYLLLAGKAYVKLTEDSSYVTGDSMGLKGNQEIYLVPLGYLKKSAEDSDRIYVTNPTSKPENVAIDLSTFFAKKLGLLTDKGYVEKKDENGKTYYYLDFVSNEAQNEYVKCIVQDKYLESLFNSKDISYKNDDIIEKDAIKYTIEMGLARFFDKNTEIKIVSGATVYTSGTLLQVTKESGYSSISILGNNMENSSVLNSSTNAANKYKLIKSFLALDDTVDYTDFPENVTIDGSIHKIEFDTSNNPVLLTPYERIVNKEKLDTLKKNIINNENGTIAAVITSKADGQSGSYTIPNGVTNGVVLGYGVDIVVNSNFEGLIITDGKITVKDSAAVTTGTNNRAELTLDVYKDVAEYFNAFQETSDTNKLDEVEMNQLLNFSEWRKNENVDYN